MKPWSRALGVPSSEDAECAKQHAQGVVDGQGLRRHAEYLGTPADAEVFTEDNAFGLLESMRIDTGLLGPFGIHH
ncbi:hypothetical protein [Nonomuraea sp. NPDC003201]